MNISEISIRNHVFAWMLMTSLLLFGFIAFKRMGVSQLPDVDFPTVSVSVSLDGASPEVMELDVADTIESALTTVPGIKNMSSTSRTGSTDVSVEFDLSKDIDVAVQEIESAMSKVLSRLPKDVDPPSIRKSNPDDQPILWISVISEKMDRRQLMTYVRDKVQDRFSTVAGVGEIFLSGYYEPSLRVWLSQEKLNQFELTATDVVSAIQREHSEKPGGRIENSTREVAIRTMGEAPNREDFENLTISRRGGSVNHRPIPLKYVATVEEGTSDIRSISRTDGLTAVGLGIKKQPGANSVEVAQMAKKRLNEIIKQLPEGTRAMVRFDQTTFIEESVSELNFTLLFSALLTALVCWLFLGSWSATLNILLAIPTSVVGTFIVLNALGFTLNTFTLLGLSLAIGIVVDDAIMVLENIVRHKEMGKSRLQAALDGSKEITLAALAATAAIIAIFLPVAFMDGVIGRFFWQFGITLSVAVGFSLLEALTLTPMRCSRFLDTAPRTSRLGKAVEQGFVNAASLYRKVIPTTVKHPWKTLGVALGIFALTLFIGTRLRSEFIPTQDQSRLIIRLQTPVGSSLTFTDSKIQLIEAYLKARSEVEGYFSSAGGGGGSSQSNSGFLYITLKPANKRSKSAQDLSTEFRRDLSKIPDAKIILYDPSLGVLGGRRNYPIAFTITGPNWETLAESSKKVRQKMEETGLMTDVDSNYQDGMPEIHVIPDRVKAREYGVDVSEISQTVNTMLAGVIAAKYSKDGRRYDVRVGLPVESRATMDIIKKIKVRNTDGELVPLSYVAKIKESTSLQSISREDRQRAINVVANVVKGGSQTAAIDAVNKIAREVLPEGYSALPSGSSKTFQDSFNGLLIAFVLGLVVSYMVLASQFNSFVHPITILMALPFSLSGAFLALFLGNQSLNVYSMIGLILLMGIVKKNSILLVEFTNHFRHKGLSAKDALYEACPVRLRPILMTSIATIVGAIPAALAWGPGAESRVPMALAVIGGVTLSTLLTLFIVPSVYVLLDRFEGESSNEVSR